MPDFANLRRALVCEGEPKRVPLFEGTVAEEIKSRFLGKPATGLETEVEFFMKAGYDFVPLTIGLRQTMRGEMSGVMGTKDIQTDILKPVEAAYNPFSDTPKTRMWAEEGSGVIVDQRTFDDFPWPDPESFSYQTVERLGSLLPPEAKAIVNVGYVFMASWMLMGLERFCLAIAESSPLVHQLIDRVGSIQLRVVEILLQYDCVGAIRMPDDLAHTGGLVVRPEVLRKHIFPWDKRIGDLVHRKGLPYLYHSDGRLYEVLDDLVACGFNALHPCEPASMDIAWLKTKYGGRLCLCGNINLDSTLTLGTPDDVRQEVKERLATIAPGGGYCCGASNSVPEYVPYENYIAMIDTVKQYGGYPIRIEQ